MPTVKTHKVSYRQVKSPCGCIATVAELVTESEPGDVPKLLHYTWIESFEHMCRKHTEMSLHEARKEVMRLIDGIQEKQKC